jgi:glycosyltransferase involved in cell wall biosynthesis
VSGICRELRGCRPDLVHLHTGRANWLGGLAAWRLSLPAVTTRRMDRPVKRNLRTRFIYGAAVRRAVAISPPVRDQLLAAGVPESMTCLIASAVDREGLYPRRERRALRRELGIATQAPLLLAVAALVPRKGLDVLLEALAELARRDLHPLLCIAGEGPERATLERHLGEDARGARVRFLGHREDVPDLLAACDVFVLPSRREGLGVAALEAMALARPVVATQVGGLGSAVVHERTGLLVPPDDAGALARALERLLRDPALRERLGAAGPGRVAEGFRVEQMVEAYERLYREVITEAGGR